MSSRRMPCWFAWGAPLAVAIGSCSARRDARHETAHRRVANGPVVARIGNDPVTADEVRTTARAEGIADARAALDRVVAERLLADEATRRGLDRDPFVLDMARRAGSQALLATVVEPRVDPATLPAADVAAAMRTRGFELSHGPLWRTEHVLVPVPAHADDDTRAGLRARAEEIRTRLLALPTARADAATQVARAACGTVACRTEVLPAFDANGLSREISMVRPFVEAAVQLENPGDVSPVAQTEFGYHVIVLLQRIPAEVRPRSEVEAIVRQELTWQVRHRELDRLLEQLRQRYGVSVGEPALRAVVAMPLTGPG